MRDLARLELLQHFSASDIEDLSAFATLVEHKAGTHLRSAQGAGNKVYIMKQGEAATRRGHRLVEILKEGDVLWEGVLFDSGETLLDIVAQTDITVYSIDGDEFLRFLRTHAGPATEFLLTMLRQVTQRLYSVARLMDTVVGLETIGHTSTTAVDLQAKVEQLVERGLADVIPSIGCAVYMWNRFDDSYDAILCRNTSLGPEPCWELASAEEERRYLKTDSGVLLAIRIVEGGELYGILLLEKKDRNEAFSRLEELVFTALARQLGLVFHLHQDSQESAALQRLRNRSLLGL